jgi:hypothetical protein
MRKPVWIKFLKRARFFLETGKMSSAGFRTGFFPPIFCGTDPVRENHANPAKSGAGSGPVPVSILMYFGILFHILNTI